MVITGGMVHFLKINKKNQQIYQNYLVALRVMLKWKLNLLNIKGSIFTRFILLMKKKYFWTDSKLFFNCLQLICLCF